MKQELEAIRAKALEAIGGAEKAEDLEALRVQYLGKRGELTAVLKQMGKLSAEERPKVGQLANEVRANIEALVEERTGANEANKFFKLNPYVSDIPEKYAREVNGVKLLVMGTVDTGGSGCVCPEHVMLKALLSALTYRKDDVVIMDMEAGLEHLGRGTAANMDQFLVVVEPGARSVQTYGNVKRLAADLGVKRVRVVANKVRDERDEAYVRSVIPAEDFLGCIHYNPEIMDADRNGKSPYDFSRTAMEEIRNIKAILDRDEK